MFRVVPLLTALKASSVDVNMSLSSSALSLLNGILMMLQVARPAAVLRTLKWFGGITKRHAQLLHPQPVVVALLTGLSSVTLLCNKN